MPKLSVLLRHPGKRLLFAAVALISAALFGAGWLVSRQIDPFPHYQWQPIVSSNGVPTPALPSPAASLARSASGLVETPPLDTKATVATKAPAPPSSQPSKSTYFIQLGAFANLTHARALAGQIARIGYRASVSEAAKTGGALVYRVRIDHAADRRSAEKLVAILKQRIPGARPILLRRER